MVFCTKCGGEIDKDWKHCPSCGQIATKKTVSKRKSAESAKPTIIAKDAIPVVNGIPIHSTKQNILQAKSLNLEENDSNKNFNKFIMIFFSILGIVLLGIGLINNNSARNERAYQESKIKEEKDEIAQINAQINSERIQTDKRSFINSLSAFKYLNCKPYFTKGENWDMTLGGVEGIEKFPIEYIFNPKQKIEWESMGNSIDRTLITIASYELQLSPLYWSIFDIYKEEGMGGYKSMWNQNFNFLDKMATKLCYQNEPSPQQLALVEESMLAISSWRLDFQSWIAEAKESRNRISEEISEYVKDMNTPKCTETKTNIPGYNIIKCTNLP